MENLTNKNILIIEDESGIYDTIHYALQTEGFRCEWAQTGSDAVKKIGEGRFHLLILDVGLPDINGFELFKQIWSRSKIPVIFLTARSAEIDRVLGLELGADDYIAKPFSPRELAARVKAVLRRTAGIGVPDNESPPAEDLPLQIDRRKKRITYYGKIVDCSKYEYRILEVMLGHPGWVFSRQQLMERIWEEPDMSLERTIDSHIKNIRRKLNQLHPDGEVIVTHHGMGYSLREKW